MENQNKEGFESKERGEEVHQSPDQDDNDDNFNSNNVTATQNVSTRTPQTPSVSIPHNLDVSNSRDSLNTSASSFGQSSFFAASTHMSPWGSQKSPTRAEDILQRIVLFNSDQVASDDLQFDVPEIPQPLPSPKTKSPVLTSEQDEIDNNINHHDQKNQSTDTTATEPLDQEERACSLTAKSPPNCGSFMATGFEIYEDENQPQHPTTASQPPSHKPSQQILPDFEEFQDQKEEKDEEGEEDVTEQEESSANQEGGDVREDLAGQEEFGEEEEDDDNDEEESSETSSAFLKKRFSSQKPAYGNDEVFVDEEGESEEDEYEEDEYEEDEYEEDEYEEDEYAQGPTPKSRYPRSGFRPSGSSLLYKLYAQNSEEEEEEQIDDDDELQSEEFESSFSAQSNKNAPIQIDLSDSYENSPDSEDAPEGEYDVTHKKIKLESRTSALSTINENQRPARSLFVDENQRPNRTPFVDENQRPNRTPFVDENQKPNRALFADENQRPSRLPFVDENQRPNRTPFVDENQRPNRTPFVDENQRPNRTLFSQVDENAIPRVPMTNSTSFSDQRALDSQSSVFLEFGTLNQLSLAKKEIFAKDQLIQELRDDITHLNSKMVSTETQLKKEKESVQDLHLQLQQALTQIQSQARLSTSVMSPSNFSPASSASNLDPDELQHTINKLKHENSQKQLEAMRTISTLEVQVQKLQSQLSISEQRAKQQLTSPFVSPSKQPASSDQQQQTLLIKNLQSELNHFRTLENTYKQAVHNANLLQQRHVNSEKLSEENETLRLQLSRANEKLTKHSQILLELEELKQEKEKWDQILEKYDSPFVIQQRITELQNQNQLFVEKNGTLQMELQQTKKNLEREQMETKSAKNQALHLENVLDLCKKDLESHKTLAESFRKERDGLKEILNSYNEEDKIGNTFDKQKTQRIVDLESTLKEREKEFEGVRKRLDDVLKKNEKLEKEVQGLVREVSEYEMRLGKGEFNPEKTKVMHMALNPLAEIQIKQRDEKIRDMQTRLEQYESQGVSSSKEVVELQEKVKQALSKEEKMRQELVQLQTRIEKQKTYFVKTFVSYREIVRQLTGFQIEHNPSNEQYILKHIYAPNETEEFRFQINSDETLEVLESSGTDRFGDKVEKYLVEQNSIPSFLAYVTLKYFANMQSESSNQ